MGWFDDAIDYGKKTVNKYGETLAGVPGGTTTTAIGGSLNAVRNATETGMPIDQPAQPETPEERQKREYNDKIKALSDEAGAMHWHSEGRKREFAGQEDTDVRRQLSDALSRVSANSNKRGFLGGGIQKQAEAQAIGTAGNAYAGETARYNQYDSDLMKAYDQATVESQQAQYSDKAADAEHAYRLAVDKANKWEAARGSIFAGVGSILGGILGS